MKGLPFKHPAVFGFNLQYSISVRSAAQARHSTVIDLQHALTEIYY